MITEKVLLQTEVVASEDAKYTYEVRRTWRADGKTAVVIELYPTINLENCGKMDLSTMHLLNHAMSDFEEWGEIRIVNLYAKVFHARPLQEQLHEDIENIAHIEGILDECMAADVDIVISWGSSLEGHGTTKAIKKELLEMIKKRGLENQVKHMVVDKLDTSKQRGTHALYLGLKYSKEKWMLAEYPVDEVLAELSPKTTAVDTGEKKRGRKGKKKDVLPDKELA